MIGEPKTCGLRTFAGDDGFRWTRVQLAWDCGCELVADAALSLDPGFQVALAGVDHHAAVLLKSVSYCDRHTQPFGRDAWEIAWGVFQPPTRDVAGAASGLLSVAECAKCHWRGSFLVASVDDPNLPPCDEKGPVCTTRVVVACGSCGAELP